MEFYCRCSVSIVRFHSIRNEPPCNPVDYFIFCDQFGIRLSEPLSYRNQPDWAIDDGSAHPAPPQRAKDCFARPLIEEPAGDREVQSVHVLGDHLLLHRVDVQQAEAVGPPLTCGTRRNGGVPRPTATTG